MNKISVVFFLSILTIVLTAPSRLKRATTPAWHKPCGMLKETEATSGNDEEVRISLESIKLLHILTMNNYLSHDYDFLYERARRGVHKHQYIPNWVPGEKDVNAIRKLSKASSQMIASHLPKLHLDLQKFAVAFEELMEDERNSIISDALKNTHAYLIMMLCEVETNIVLLPSLQMPPRVERSIMSIEDRDPIDETRRLVRDWGIVLKYRDYLHSWRHVFDY
ncbi:uncharacterized protein LOC127283044 [Leptopilina boulardi]|uniref:uncharacterized protein LOC127283044 n=1 Tax=Leptopilina boulardi TaxID=63433 RepID=UPI0021F68100|nr:uncharacterized protein LOC127283044 [Leptopilina boulardi]